MQCNFAALTSYFTGFLKLLIHSATPAMRSRNLDTGKAYDGLLFNPEHTSPCLYLVSLGEKLKTEALSASEAQRPRVHGPTPQALPSLQRNLRLQPDRPLSTPLPPTSSDFPNHPFTYSIIRLKA